MSPLIVSVNGLSRSDVVHVHTVGPFSLFMLSIGKRKVVTAHITAQSLVGSLVGGDFFYHLATIYLRWFYNRADIVLALNHAQAVQLRDAGVTQEIVVVPNSCPAAEVWLQSKDEARRILGLPIDRDIILTVGQLQPRKGVQTFYDCARTHIDKMFVWVGSFPFGPLTAEYRAMRKSVREAPSNVLHTGVLSRDRVFSYYTAADLYFHPSHHEHAPVAALEAAAARLPLVLRDLDSYKTLLGDAYVAGTEDTFASIIGLLMSDREAYKRMSFKVDNIIDSLGPSRIADKLTSVYRALVE